MKIRRRRGVSPVIASLLLIAISVAAAVVTYSWIMAMVKTQGTQAQTSIRIDEVLFGQNPKGSTTVTTPGTDTYTIKVDSVDNFAVNDIIKITHAGADYYRKITEVITSTKQLELNATITVSPGDPVVEVSINAIKITIRNTGSVAAVIQTIYVYKGGTQILKKDGIGYAIPAGSLGEIGLKEDDGAWSNMKPSLGSEPTRTFEVTFSKDLQTSAAYLVKIVTDNGFTAEGTYYSPSSFS